MARRYNVTNRALFFFEVSLPVSRCLTSTFVVIFVFSVFIVKPVKTKKNKMFEGGGEVSEGEELPEDEEEILVYVEFPNCAENMFGNERLKLDMIGIDTESPIMQVNGKFYEGAFEDAVGTYMFFEKDNTATVDDPVFEVAPTLKYMTKTRKLLKMQRVFVTPRTEVLGDSEHNESVPSMKTIKEAGVPPKYQNEALAFWAGVRTERIDALNAYHEKQRVRKEKKSQGIEPVSDSDDENPLMFRMGQYEEQENLSDNNIEMNEFERFLRNTAERPSEDYQDHEPVDSQFEPEPSTSRESKPFISSVKSTSRNKGVVKVLKTTRRKNHSKYQRDVIRRKRITKLNAETAPSTDDLLQEISNTLQVSDERIVQETDTSVPMYENFEPLEAVNESEVEEAEVITDEIQVDQKPRYLSNDECFSMEKRLQKKAKREAKMKELSEQLKNMSGTGQEEEEDELII